MFPIADAHCDLLSKRLKRRLSGVWDGADVSAHSLREGGVALQAFAAFVNSARAGVQTAYHYRIQAEDFPGMAAEYGLSTELPDELDAASPCAIFTVEGGEAFAGSLLLLEEYAGMGMRACALTWNHENELGFPHGQTGGLKPFGVRAARAMIAYGVGIDVSHLSQQGFWQVAEMGAPFLASHSCAMALCGHSRNLTDEQIRALIECGGYIGVNFYPAFLTADDEADLGSVVRHIVHVLELGGENAVGFGSDFDGIDKKPRGLPGPSGFPALISALSRAGVPELTLKKAAGENFLRFIKKIACKKCTN